MKKIGYFCCHVPIELITASGFVPFHITGTGDFQSKSSGYFPTDFCMYAKKCLDYGLHIDKNDFAGVVFSNSCDSMERLYDIWREYAGLPFIHLLDVPRISSPSSGNYFLHQLKDLKKSLEKYRGSEISDSDLTEAIKSYNRVREAFECVRTLREKETIKASKLWNIILEKRENPDKLAFSIENIITHKENYVVNTSGPRLLLSGSIMENTALIDVIEERGANVVYEDFCSLSRGFTHPVDMSLPPLPGISERYLTKISCPRKSGSSSERLKNLKDMIKRYKVDGVLFYLIKFCDIYSWDIHSIISELKNENIPVLCIEGDYPVRAGGQIITRIQAFLEMLGDDD